MISLQGMADESLFWINSFIVLADWFAQKNINDTIIFVQYFITITKHVRSIIDENARLQFWGVFYKRAKLTSVQYNYKC